MKLSRCEDLRDIEIVISNRDKEKYIIVESNLWNDQNVRLRVCDKKMKYDIFKLRLGASILRFVGRSVGMSVCLSSTEIETAITQSFLV